MQRRQARASQVYTEPAPRWEPGESRPVAALTRRSFFALVAAAVCAPALPVAVDAAARGFTSGSLGAGVAVRLHGAEQIIPPPWLDATLKAAAKQLADHIDRDALELCKGLLRERGGRC